MEAPGWICSFDNSSEGWVGRNFNSKSHSTQQPIAIVTDVSRGHLELSDATSDDDVIGRTKSIGSSRTCEVKIPPPNEPVRRVQSQLLPHQKIKLYWV